MGIWRDFSEKMPEMAANLLESGLDSPSMRRLAGEMHVRRIADVQEIIEKMFCELGVKLPASEVEAKQQTSVQIAREVIAGQRSAWKAASEMQRIWSFEIWHHKDLCDVAQLLDELDCPSIARGELPQTDHRTARSFCPSWRSDKTRDSHAFFGCPRRGRMDCG